MRAKTLYALALAFPFFASGAAAQVERTPAQQFERLKTLAGIWAVEGSESLSIEFETTAADSVLIERWKTAAGTHSLTIYHMDGPTLLATHYCPQGNQPRLSLSAPSPGGSIAFAFRDATDLDSSEEFQHELAFDLQPDGRVVRSETYWGAEGIGEETALILFRANPTE